MQKCPHSYPAFGKLFIAALCAICVLSISGNKAYARHHIKTNKHSRVYTYYYEPQNGLGGISGKITGNLFPVADARVDLYRDNKFITRTVTTEEGNFAFHFADPGSYAVIASKEGFTTSAITDVPVKPDYTTRNDFYLPKVNSKDAPKDGIAEPYSHNRKFMREN